MSFGKHQTVLLKFSISLLDSNYRVILHFFDGARDGNVSKVIDMLNDGVPVDNVDGVGTTALRCAAYKNRTDVTRILLQRGADVNKRSGWYLETALHTAVRLNNTDVIEVLLKHGASTKIKNRDSRTPFDLARDQNNKETVRLLKRH